MNEQQKAEREIRPSERRKRGISRMNTDRNDTTNNKNDLHTHGTLTQGPARIYDTTSAPPKKREGRKNFTGISGISDGDFMQFVL